MEKLNKTISEIWNDDYVVPLYQRNYTWQEPQIQQLIQDIYDHCHENDSHYYIGSLVVLQRPDGVYEVIDGQQRLTTLHLICKSLGLLDAPHLTYDSRPEVEDFFKGLFSSATAKDFSDECHKKDIRKIFRLVDAIDIVETTEIHTNQEKRNDNTVTLATMPATDKAIFKEYLYNNVILVRTILPNDTDVAAYFEIMNNRGEQLQEHEVVKALMMKDLNTKKRFLFSSIWDACSQMDIPIQKTLSGYRKHQLYPLFGENYDSLNLDYLELYEDNENLTTPLTIDEVLAQNNFIDGLDCTSQDIDTKYETIIDFPNFLMHMFKLINNDSQLNPNNLLSTYKDIKDSIDPMDFIKILLKMRTMFDRFIIKSIGEGEEDEKLRWLMLKPYHSYTKSSSSLKFRNTFSNKNDEADENELEDDVQRKIIMSESMLQVTFRSKKYKNWLFDLLSWLRDKKVNEVDANELSVYLDKWACDYYLQLENKNQLANNTKWAFEALGTDTPHFIFNFIDYLYWVAYKKNYSNIRYIDEIKDFYFHYYNSIEHHLPQSYGNIGNVNVDSIGNLCLISRRANSSLNDKAPKEKAILSADLQPKRKIMYRITHDSDGMWGEKQILEHNSDIKYLLDNRCGILES